MSYSMPRLALVILASALVASRTPAAEGAAKPEPARKVLVVAKVKEEAKRRALEDATAAQLKKRGVEPTLGSDVLTEADFATEDTIRHKVESLGVDGVIGFVPLAVDETVRTSSAHFSIGIGGGGGGMGMFVGASAPIGSSTTVLRKVKLRARYFARPFQAPLWEKTYIETLEDDVSGLVKSVSSETVNTLKKKKFIPAK